MVPLQASRARAPEELHDLIRRAYRTRQTQARLIVDFCLEHLPHYRGIPEPLLAEVRESVLHHLGILYRVTLETGRPLSQEDLATSLRTARQRAAQGVPLGEFLTFFLVGLTMAWEHLMASVGDDPTLRSQLLERVTAVISNQAQLMTALTEAYVEERERRSHFRKQDLDDFLQLLTSQDATEHALEARARSLGIPLGEPLSIAIFDPGTPPGSASAGPDDLQRELVARLPGAESWLGRTPEGLVALLPPEPDAAALATGAGVLGEGRVGVGSAGCGVAGLRRSAREAQRALAIGGLLRRHERVHRYAELAVLDLVGAGSADADAFMEGVLGPLAAHPTHLETLRQLSANGYRNKLAAAALAIHPHTLSYRVKQMRRRFGLDLDDPDVRLRLQLALLILDARGAAREVSPASGRASGPAPARARRRLEDRGRRGA